MDGRDAGEERYAEESVSESNVPPTGTEHSVAPRSGSTGGSRVACKNHDSPVTSTIVRSIVPGGGTTCDATSGLSLLAGTLDCGPASIVSALGSVTVATYLEADKSRRLTSITDVPVAGPPVANGILKVSDPGILGTMVAPTGTPIVSGGGSAWDTSSNDALTTTCDKYSHVAFLVAGRASIAPARRGA